MSRLTTHTGALRAGGRKALVAFLTAGYPTERAFADMVLAAADAGADIIEVGIPFSDPIADGPVIQAASTVVLANGMSLARALDATAELATRTDATLVAMSYVNPVLSMGLETFVARAGDAGVAGVILPDVSFEESDAFRQPLHAAGMSYVDLVAPTSSDARIQAIAGGSEGFVYVVSLTGVTGARDTVAGDLGALTARVRAATATPVYVGFGISSPDAAAAVAEHADGVIIGSRLLGLAAEGAPEAAGRRVGDFLAGVRGALDRKGQ